MHLVFSAVPNLLSQFKTLPPCILKPEKLWSGKQVSAGAVGFCVSDPSMDPWIGQVVSTLLLNITPDDHYKLNLVSKAKIASKAGSLFIW